MTCARAFQSTSKVPCKCVNVASAILRILYILYCNTHMHPDEWTASSDHDTMTYLSPSLEVRNFSTAALAALRPNTPPAVKPLPPG
jgi:hypothetical protein